jgi:hypothetical protein
MITILDQKAAFESPGNCSGKMLRVLVKAESNADPLWMNVECVNRATRGHKNPDDPRRDPAPLQVFHMMTDPVLTPGGEPDPDPAINILHEIADDPGAFYAELYRANNRLDPLHGHPERIPVVLFLDTDPDHHWRFARDIMRLAAKDIEEKLAELKSLSASSKREEAESQEQDSGAGRRASVKFDADTMTPCFAMIISEDPANPGLLYAGSMTAVMHT